MWCSSEMRVESGDRLFRRWSEKGDDDQEHGGALNKRPSCTSNTTNDLENRRRHRNDHVLLNVRASGNSPVSWR